MYSLRVNTKTKELVEEVAAMVDLSVSAIIRKVRKKMENGRLKFIGGGNVEITRINGNVIIFHVSKRYHSELSEWLTSDISPVEKKNTTEFRTCLVAACLDSRNQSREQYDRISRMNREFAEYNSQAIAERRALYAEVM
jgi:hypothetical protein